MPLVRKERPWLVLTGLALLACGKTGASSSLCVDELTCPDEIDVVESEPGCTPCEPCADRLGVCERGGFACARGRIDLDGESDDGCESLAAELDSTVRVRQAGGAIETVTMNGRDFSAGTAVEVLAVDPLEPGCTPTFEVACPYSIAALKVTFGDFTFDDVTWEEGTATLSGPLQAEDDGTGVGFIGEAVAGFELSQGDERRRVLALGSLEARFVPGEPSTILLALRDFDFGGYRLEKIFLNAELERF
jgi:hypothetical protein